MTEIEFTSEDQGMMRQAIELAEQGRGSVEPNPMVGCLIVQDGRIIGRGYHEKFGGPHAEVNALQSCTESPQGAIAYVSLEPCSHHGKTPPCADALIEAGIRKVVIGLQDPNPNVDGRGIDRLRKAEIDICHGVLASDVAMQNAGFVKRIKTGKPWVIAKYAMTMDGKISTLSGDSKWISNERCREHVHQLRSQIDAIIVGSNTALLDDPNLTARPQNHSASRRPTRIVLDSKATIAPTSTLVRTARETPTMVVCDADQASTETTSGLEKAGVEVLRLQAGYGTRVEQLLTTLGDRQFSNVVVEGGGGVLGEFLAADQLDEVRVYMAPILIGKGRQPFSFPEVEQIADGKSFKVLQVQSLDDNIYVRGLINQQLFDSLD